MKSLSSKTLFWQGNEACVEAAIIAGCRFFAGYPISPANEITEHISKRLPQVGGIFMQMEDELASIGAVVGASWTGNQMRARRRYAGALGNTWRLLCNCAFS